MLGVQHRQKILQITMLKHNFMDSGQQQLLCTHYDQAKQVYGKFWHNIFLELS